MSAGSAHTVLRFIRRLASMGDATATPDAQLLTRFVAARDETAFAALVRRHGPMVLGVCARILGNTADAEDAFQATFLVLVRRAGSVGRPDLLGNWLYGVAYRTALKARTDAARRKRHESKVATQSALEAIEEADGGELRRALDDELNRLPAKYRLPLVLCHLDGLTHEEAARRLGCPRETVTTRLVRARDRLRKRLVERGAVLGAAGFAGFLEGSSLAALPNSLVGQTVDVAKLMATAPGIAARVISARIVALTEGVLRTMFMTKLKIGVVVLLALGIVGWGATALAPKTWASQPPIQAKEEAAPAPAAEANAVERGDKAEGSASVKALPPVVVKTVPESGDTHVDATAVKEIRVTFSKEMADKSWSWSQISNDTFPKNAGEPHYDKSKRTCMLPVKLEPKKTYVIWLNSENFGNFKDAEGRSAVPYLLVFETKP
jgi:RNA polymerase sigma-70 factor (ECF subfamily)